MHKNILFLFIKINIFIHDIIWEQKKRKNERKKEAKKKEKKERIRNKGRKIRKNKKERKKPDLHGGRHVFNNILITQLSQYNNDVCNAQNSNRHDNVIIWEDRTIWKNCLKRVFYGFM